MPLDGVTLGRYQIVRLIGSGGMGEVYLAEDTRISRQIVIKVVRNEAAADPETDSIKDAHRLFFREAKTIAALNHPHILPLFDYGEESINETPLTYMVMPYCANGSLATWLRLRSNSSVQPLTPQHVVQIVLQAASALQYAHDQGIIHQDVKPQNFLMRGWRDMQVPDLVLSDFGLAKFMGAHSSTSQSIRGTPVYMAPEQWLGQPVAASDQYALAVMAYQMLTGHLPFKGGPGQIMYQHLTVPPLPPSTHVPELSKDIDKVILTALAKKPEERFLAVSAFAHALEQAVQGIDAQPTLPTMPDMQSPTLVSAPANASQQGSLPADTPTLRQSEDTHTVLARETRAPIYPEPPAPVPPATFLPLSTPPLTVQREVSRSSRAGKSMLLLLSLLVLLILATSVGTFLYLTRPGLPKGQSTPTVVNTGATATALAQAHGTATSLAATATSAVPSPTVSTFGSGTLVLDDPLSDNSRGYTWEEGLRDGGYCTFTGGAYHASIAQAGHFHSCLALAKDFSDFSYSVNMTIVSGNYGGIVFRADRATTHFYYFLIDSTGNYTLQAFFDKVGDSNVITSGSTGAFDTRPNATNTLGVFAHGSAIDLYVNGQDIKSVTDSTFMHGQVGVVVLAGEATFSNAKVWV